MTMPFEDDTQTQLAERIRGFNHDDASPTEQAQLCDMLKQLAEATVDRWELVRDMEKSLAEKLSMADVYEKMSEVLVVTGEGNYNAPRLMRERLGELDRDEPTFWQNVGRIIAGREHWTFPR